MFKEMRLEKSKKGLPVAWERGGGATRTGAATIIAGPKGEALVPLYVRTRGDLSNGDHALFVVDKGCLVIRADHHRGDFGVSVYRITEITTRPCGREAYGSGKDVTDVFAWHHSRGEKPSCRCLDCGEVSWAESPNNPITWTCGGSMPVAHLELVATYDRGEWTPGFDPEDFRAAIEAAKDKAECYHCRRPFYMKEASEKAA